MGGEEVHGLGAARDERGVFDAARPLNEREGLPGEDLRVSGDFDQGDGAVEAFGVGRFERLCCN